MSDPSGSRASARVIGSQRIELVPASPRSLRAALQDRGVLADAVDAVVPPSWPPELLDDDALRWVLNRLADPTVDPQWLMYWIVLREPRTLIGTCGFKGPPADGMVELGYGIVVEHQRRGYATEATRALVEHAFAHPGITMVTAETLPDLVASIGVLEKCGFVLVGEGSEPGVIRYELKRASRSRPAAVT